MKEWGKVLRANGNQKEDRLAMLVSDKTDFKTKTVIRDKGNTKLSIQEKHRTFVNIYALTLEASKYIKH